ncbi:MAG TPA: hypothetical protein VGD05_09575 [Pyrinomonadaceae bacterium]
MKITLFLFVILLTSNIFGQIERNQIAPTEVSLKKIEKIEKIERIYLAKDDKGTAGEEAEIFSTTDIPIYCVIYLKSVKPSVIKMNFIAVKVAGVKLETKVISASYKTDGNQSQVYFTGKPDGLWIAGSYRIDIFIDGEAAGNKEFEILKSPDKARSPASIDVKNLIPPKPKPKPAPRNRKN